MPLQSTLRGFWRYRPRVLTLLLLFVVAAPIALANFTSEMQVVPGRHSLGDVFTRGLYGWPLMWHWHNVAGTMATDNIVGWEYSRARLAANLACWSIMLAVPAAACEWLLRRYRPRLRWSLRTMLAGVAAAAVFCAWFAAARNRANVQDPIIAKLEHHNQCVAVERPAGPKWLEFVVPDNFRRRIVGLDMTTHGTADEAFVVRLGRLPRLKYLNLHVERLTPAMAAALRSMRELRWLYINEAQPSSESLAALGKLTQLEGLQLNRPALYTYRPGLTPGLARDGLSLLAGLTSLKTLCVESAHLEGAFSQMPALPRLEALHIEFSAVSGQDLRRLSVLPRLRALDLKYADLGPDVDLGDLAKLDSLEELTVAGDNISAAGLEWLTDLKRLRALHITERIASFKESDAPVMLKLDDRYHFPVCARELDGFSRALHKLRQSHPGIVIDGDRHAIDYGRFPREPPWDAIKYGHKLEPPWDKLESSAFRSTWLPRRLTWAEPSLILWASARASDPAAESDVQNHTAKREE